MRRKSIALFMLGAASLPLHSDDGAASIAAGGIIVMKREARIVMAKELLQIFHGQGDSGVRLSE